jgi:hypothetical protein
MPLLGAAPLIRSSSRKFGCRRELPPVAGVRAVNAQRDRRRSSAAHHLVQGRQHKVEADTAETARSLRRRNARARLARAAGLLPPRRPAADMVVTGP